MCCSFVTGLFNWFITKSVTINKFVSENDVYAPYYDFLRPRKLNDNIQFFWNITFCPMNAKRHKVSIDLCSQSASTMDAVTSNCQTVRQSDWHKVTSWKRHIGWLSAWLSCMTAALWVSRAESGWGVCRGWRRLEVSILGPSWRQESMAGWQGWGLETSRHVLDGSMACHNISLACSLLVSYLCEFRRKEILFF